MSTFPAVHDAIQTLIEAARQAAEETVQSASQKLRDGRLDSAQKTVNQSRAIRDFLRRDLPHLQRQWRSIERNRSLEPNATKAPTTPADDIARAILDSLEELGGTARASDVLERVARRLAPRLLPADHVRTSNGQPRWKATARYARDRLVRDGTLRPGDRPGIWILTASYPA